jgi:hypothetical protein
MAVLRRAFAAFTGLMMFGLVVTESGFVCAMPEMAAMSGAHAPAAPAGDAHGDMAGMSMPAESEGGPASDGEEAPCRFPWAPSGCRDMAPCAPATLVVAAWRPAPTPPGHDALAAGRVLLPASIDRPPEPPPPRA